VPQRFVRVPHPCFPGHHDSKSGALDNPGFLRIDSVSHPPRHSPRVGHHPTPLLTFFAYNKSQQRKGQWDAAGETWHRRAAGLEASSKVSARRPSDRDAIGAHVVSDQNVSLSCVCLRLGNSLTLALSLSELSEGEGISPERTDPLPGKIRLPP
jgi:hypothetical protein